MLEMIQRVEFKTNTYSNDLQKKLNKDVKEIQEEHNIFVKADKTTNYYKTAPENYMTLVKKNEDLQEDKPERSGYYNSRGQEDSRKNRTSGPN